MDFLAIAEGSDHTPVRLGVVLFDARVVAYVLLASAEQNLLEVGPVDDARVWHAAAVSGALEVELGVPLVAHAVLDAIRPVARPRRARLDLLVELLVDVTNGLHRVRRELDRPAKLFELAGALQHGVAHWRASHLCGELEAVGQDEAAHTRTCDQHIQRLLRGDHVARLRRRLELRDAARDRRAGRAGGGSTKRGREARTQRGKGWKEDHDALHDSLGRDSSQIRCVLPSSEKTRDSISPIEAAIEKCNARNLKNLRSGA